MDQADYTSGKDEKVKKKKTQQQKNLLAPNKVLQLLISEENATSTNSCG